MTFKSAYIHLTIYYVLTAMTINIAFSAAIYQISSSELGRGLNRQTGILRNLPNDHMIPSMMQDLENIRLEQMETSSNHLQLNLLYFNLLILALSAFSGYFFAKRTMHPIEEMVEAQNRFTADASHELRTPLTAMRSEIEVGLRDEKITLSEQKKLLESNLEEIEKLESLSSALLKLAKYQQESKVNFKTLHLPEILIEAYEKVENMAEKKSIKFDNKLENLQVLGDHQSLVELFVILLDNAIKYSPQKSKIKISIEKHDHRAVVKIADSGIGVKASDLPHIFERFYRADNSRCKNSPDGICDGYGLGLSIAKSIVDFHDGEISVKSDLGKGSEFSVKL